VFVDDAQHLRCVVGDDAGHWVLERPVAGLTCCPTNMDRLACLRLVLMRWRVRLWLSQLVRPSICVVLSDLGFGRADCVYE
jgi:hypothetical protein